MKLLFFTDSHIRGTTPKNRKDNYYDTLKKKFFEIKDIVEKENVDIILNGGDWFDRPDISPSIVREFAQIINTFNRPIYTVAGNHDIYGHNPSTINRTMLGILEGIGMVTLMNFDEKIFVEKDGLRVQLSGSPYSYDIDGDEFRKYYIVRKEKDVDYAIHIIHGMLLNKPFFEGIQYTLLEDIKDTEADITLAGHYHNGFGVKKIDSKYFINPGNIIRISNSLAEIKRKPKVIIIELGLSILINEVELKCALDGEEVLDREQLEYSHDRNLKLHEFYNQVSTTGEFKKIDLNNIIEDIAANQEITKEVKDEAVRRIAIARESLSNSNSE